MREIIDAQLFPVGARVGSGERIRSSIIDVGGAETVAISVFIYLASSDVFCTVNYRSKVEHSSFLAQFRETFVDTDLLSMSIPVFGTYLAIDVENRRTQSIPCWGTVYAVR